MPSGVYDRKVSGYNRPSKKTETEKKENHRRAVAKNNRSKYQEYHLRHNFGLTVEEFDNMKEKQNGVCAICGGTNSDRDLAVDHCHTSGKIRGLLCSRCNTGLGLFRDNKDHLNKAIEYLK